MLGAGVGSECRDGCGVDTIPSPWSHGQKPGWPWTQGLRLAGPGTGHCGAVFWPPDRGASAFVPLQLCPVVKAAFEDARTDILRLVSGRCSALSHLFPLLLSQPPHPGSAQERPPKSSLSSNLAQQQASMNPSRRCTDRNSPHL